MKVSQPVAGQSLVALLSSRPGVISVTKWIYSIVRRFLGLPPSMTLPESAGIKAEVRQWREEDGQGGLKKQLGRTAARAGGQGERGSRPEMCPPAQLAGLTGRLLPAPEIQHHLLGKEPPSSWSLLLPHPWKPVATKLSAAPSNTAPGRESILSWRPSGGVGSWTLSLSPGTLEVRNWAQTHIRVNPAPAVHSLYGLEPWFPHLSSAGLLRDCKH